MTVPLNYGYPRNIAVSMNKLNYQDPAGGGGGVIRISSDGDKIFDSGIFLDGITLGGLI